MKRRKRIRRFIILFLSVIVIVVGYGKFDNMYHETASLENGWNLILVNQDNYIPEDYEVELQELSNGKLVDARIYEALVEMMETAEDEGYYMVVVEAYRTAQEQQTLMNEKIDAYEYEGYPEFLARYMAEKWVAIPGTSEHQLGIAVDINPDYDKSGREVYDWLAKNAYQFGFINRYPEEKIHITGIGNEPWHYRYVGEDVATKMYKQGICLEEFLENY